ncbi:hypothetical protein ACQKWADRAFT_74323 [Trichoderma austrokoningii]
MSNYVSHHPALEVFNSNFSTADSMDDHFQQCWAQQSCGGCLDTVACSWCPYTWSCVPNQHAIPLLAPAFNAEICPHPDERWEVRTRPLGCKVSSRMGLTVAVTVVATLAAVLVVAASIILVRKMRKSGTLSWERISRWKLPFQRQTDRSDPERGPLLSAQQEDSAGNI